MSPSSRPVDKPPAQPGLPAELVGVRYSLTQMLAELSVDRASGSLAKEKLDQAEIGKLFKTQPHRRAKSSK
jgi:hypothetical protein